MKNLIRKDKIKQRMYLSEREIKSKSRLIVSNILSHFYLFNKSVGCYSSIRNEVNILDISKYTKGVSLPSVSNNGMIFKKWNTVDPLKSGDFGIMEPIDPSEVVQPDVLLIPLVAFDEKCNRIGYGKGFYDKYMANFSGIKIGCALDMQKVSSIPIDKTDIPLHYVVTENKVYYG